MKNLFWLFALVVGLLFTGMAGAASTAAPTVNDVKLELLHQLEKDGYLSAKLAQEATNKYVNPQDLQAPTVTVAAAKEATKSESLWERWVSWSNFFKVVAVVLFLVAFGGFIMKVVIGAWLLITKVPVEVYQAGFLGLTAVGTLWPQLLWADQAFYIALFCAFANIGLAGWVLESHPKLEAALKKLFNLGLPPASVASAWGVAYFAALALAYQSQVFGFFAAVCLSGVFSFTMYYRVGVLVLDFKDNAMGAVIFGHLAVLALYCGLFVSGYLPAQANLFAAGLEYYCTLAMGVGFLVATSPFRGSSYSGNVGGYLLLFVLVLVASLVGYFFYDLKVIASVLCCFAVLVALEWYGFLSFRAGFIVGSFAMGAALFGLSVAMEHYGSYLVLTSARVMH